MFKTFFKTSWRNLKRNKVFSIVNILGLAVGFAASGLILLYSSHEMSFDKFHDDADRIHRVTMSFKNGNEYTTTATSPYSIAPSMAKTFALIEETCRLYYAFNSKREIIYGDKRIDITDNFTHADPNFFDFWSFDLIQGEPSSALKNVNAIVLTESEAIKLFGGENPIGKTVQWRAIYEDVTFDVEVTGVMKDIPSNSHIPYNYYLSMAWPENEMPSMIDNWGWTSQNTYIKLSKGSDIRDINEGLPQMIEDNAPDWYKSWAYLGTQPLTDIHLKSKLKEEIVPPGDATYVNLLIIVAIFILIIASINYMNLATAIAASRVKEIGVKKAVGASKYQLVWQFMIESVTTGLISAALAFTLLQFSLGYFNMSTGMKLDLFSVDGNIWLIVAAVVLVISLGSGIYPAFYLSSFQPVKAISDKAHSGKSRSESLRKGLVILQFSISSFLIAVTFIVLNQWQYMREQSLGLESDLIVTLDLPSQNSIHKYSALKNELETLPEIAKVGISSKSPSGRYSSFGGVYFEGNNISMPHEFADREFFQILDIDFIEGENFPPGILSDSNAVILNQKAIKILDINEPIGKSVGIGDRRYKIIGVTEDFHFEPLYAEVGPVVFRQSTISNDVVYVELGRSSLPGAMDKIKKTWFKVNPNENIKLDFADEEIARAYQSEENFLWIFTTFSALAIFIACLGLFGLASFTVSKKVKEIGIRKILGATPTSIVASFCFKFGVLVIYANLIAMPIAYVIMQNWLEKFPYRTSVGLWVFASSLIVSLIVAIVSVSGNSIKASMVNPVKSLRYE